MRKNFLLLLLLTLLPLAGWAQTASWVSGSAPDDLVYGDAVPSIPSLVSVTSSWGGANCASQGEGTSYPTGNTNAYHWKLSKGGSNVSGTAPLQVGDYTLTLYIRHQTNWSSYGNATRTLTFSVAKKEITMSLYQVIKEWRNPWVNPTVASLDASSYSLPTGITLAEVQDYLTWNQLQTVVNVGSYKYTLTPSDHPNYIIHIAASEAELKVEKNTTAYWEEYATDGDNLTYKKDTEQELAPKDLPVLWDTDNNVAGTIEYSLDGVAWSADYPKVTDAGSYVVYYRAKGDDNHDVSGVSTETYNVEIEKADATLAVTLDPTTYVYSPTLTVAPGYTSDNEETGGTVSYEYSTDGMTWGPFAPEVSDTWQVRAIQAETANYFETTSAPLDFTVTAPAIEESWLTWTDNSDYDATDQLGTIETGITILDGTDATPLVLGTDYTIAIMKGGSAVTEVTNAGEYTFTFTGIGNYDGQFSKTFTMNKVAWVTVSDPVLAADWEYDGTEHLLIEAGNEATATGYGTDAVDPAEIVYYLDGTATALADLKVKNANEAPGYTVSFSINETENYLAVDKADLTPVIVSKKGLIITGASIKEVYKEPKWTFEKNELFVIDTDAIVGDDKLLSAEEQQTLVAGLITTTLTGVGDDIPVTDVTPGLDRGAYTIHLGDAAADVKNYKIKTLTDGGLTIEQAPNKFNNLEVADWTYGEAANAPVYDVDFKADDEPTFTYAVKGSTEFGTYDKIVKDQAGDYTVKAVVEQTNNYLAAEETADFTIAKADLTIDVDHQTKVYGEEDPELTYAAAGFQWDDDATTIDIQVSRVEGEDVGKYAITATFDADKAKNYNITNTPEELEITKADLAITVKDLTKVYGDEDPEFVLDPAPEYKNGDDAEKIGLKIEREEGEAVGTYAITASATAIDNYNVTFTPGELEITAAELEIEVADNTKVYGDEDPELVLANEPAYQNGDDAEAIGLKIEREVGEDVGKYAITATATSKNYTYKFTAGEFEITKAPLTLTAKALTKVYGDADPELVLAEEPAYKNGDDATAIGLTITRAEGENVDKYTITPAATSENYEYEIVEADFEITPATLVYTLGNYEYPYTGEAYEPVQGETFAKTDGKFFFEDAYGKTFTFAWPDEAEVKDAKIYTFNKLDVNWADGQAENYYIIFSKDAVVTVNPAEIAFTPAEAFEGLTYTGEAQTLIETPATATFTDFEEKVTEFDIEYSLDNATWSDELPEGTEAGEYEVYTKVIDETGNFVAVEPEVIKVTIGPKVMTFDLAFENDEWTYDGVAVTIEDLKAYDGEKALEAGTDYELTITKDGEAFEGALVNAGEYVFAYAGVEKSNYEGSAAEVTIVIDPAELNDDMVALSATSTEYNTKDQKPTYTLTYEPEGKPALTLAEETDFEADAEEKFINAGEYTFTFTGKGNYTGEAKATFNIEKLELIATAPNAKKTYDGTNTVENEEFGDFAFNGLLGGDHVDLGGATIMDFVIVPEDAINVGEYTLTIEDVEAFPEQQNYYVGSALPGTLTIDPAKEVTIAFTAAAKYGKEYAAKDELEVVAGDLMATPETGWFDDFADIADQLTISREEGEDVGTYDVMLALGEKAEFQKNYEKVNFAVGADKFEITPFATELKISIASFTRNFNGDVAEYAWADDLSNMVVTNLPEGKEKSEIFTKLPEVKVVDAGKNVGEYNVELTGGESKNYTFKLLPGSYYTIEPVAVKAVFNSIPVAAVGLLGEDVLAQVDWAVEAVDEEDAATLEANKGLFELIFADGVLDANKKIAEGETGEAALVINYKGEEDPANFAFDGDNTADLNIGGAGAEVALDDAGEIVTYASENSTVTFTQSRKVKTNVWQAAVLPFDATPAQISDAFGYAAVDVLDPTRTNADEVHFSLNVSETVKAGTPFLFKTDNEVDFNTVTFENVNLVNTDGLNTTVKDDDTDIEFIGTFKKIGVWGEQFRYLSGGTWYNAGKYTEAKPANIKPLRAYLNMGSNAGARIIIEEPDGTTSIMDVRSFNEDMTAEGWYTIDGKKLNAAPTQKGVYIQNGQKVVIK